MGQIRSGKDAASLRAATRALGALFFLMLLFAAALPGCSKKSVEPEKPRPDYSKVLNAETRTTKVYSGLDAVLFITATYKTMEFREAYVDLYAKGYEVDPSYLAALLDREREENDRYNEIFFTAYTSDSKINDFDKRDSVWRLYLDDSEGDRLTPVSVTKLDSNDPVLRKFFPYLDQWSSAYTVRFPKYSVTGNETIPGPGTKFIKLVVTGVMGRGELEWRFND